MGYPLELHDDDWRSRWLVFESWRCLHRVAEIAWWDDSDKIRGDGVTVCGTEGFLMMPGIMSRMGLRRCKKCCDMMGVPSGEGSPYNEGVRSLEEQPVLPK